MSDKLPPSAPYKPVPYEPADVLAVQALAAGTASEDQQKRFIKWLVYQACGTYDLSYRPESVRDTDFAEGRRFVGLQVVKLNTLNARALVQKEIQNENQASEVPAAQRSRNRRR